MVRVKGNYVQRWVHRPDLLSLQRNKWNPITRHLWMKKKYTDRPTTYWTTVIVRQMTREYIQMALTPRPMTIEEHDCQTNTDNLKPYVGWRDQGSWWRWILRNNGCYVLRKIHAPPSWKHLAGPPQNTHRELPGFGVVPQLLSWALQFYRPFWWLFGYQCCPS